MTILLLYLMNFQNTIQYVAISGTVGVFYPVLKVGVCINASHRCLLSLHCVLLFLRLHTVKKKKIHFQLT